MSVAFDHLDKSSLGTVDLVGHSSIEPSRTRRRRPRSMLASKAQSCMITLQLGYLTKKQRERQGSGPRWATIPFARDHRPVSNRAVSTNQDSSVPRTGVAIVLVSR